MQETVYRASRLRVIALTLLCVVGAAILASPWFTDFLYAAPLTGRWEVLNVLGAEGRVIASYLGAGLCVFAAFVYGRLAIDNVVLRLDGEGITARHRLGTQRGYWSEFRDIKSFGFGRTKGVWLQFEGKRGSRKVHLPFSALGTDLKNFKTDVTARLVLSGRLQALSEAKKPAPEARSTFGKRSAPVTPGSPPVIQEGFRLFGRRPAG